jgi:hypothetical protein
VAGPVSSSPAGPDPNTFGRGLLRRLCLPGGPCLRVPHGGPIALLEAGAAAGVAALQERQREIVAGASGLADAAASAASITSAAVIVRRPALTDFLIWALFGVFIRECYGT